jgi:hypothetical protein
VTTLSYLATLIPMRALHNVPCLGLEDRVNSSGICFTATTCSESPHEGTGAEVPSSLDSSIMHDASRSICRINPVIRRTPKIVTILSSRRGGWVI